MRNQSFKKKKCYSSFDLSCPILNNNILIETLNIALSCLIKLLFS